VISTVDLFKRVHVTGCGMLCILIYRHIFILSISRSRQDSLQNASDRYGVDWYVRIHFAHARISSQVILDSAFATRLGKLSPGSRTGQPYLVKEVLIAITMKNQRGPGTRICGYDCYRQMQCL